MKLDLRSIGKKLAQSAANALSSVSAKFSGKVPPSKVSVKIPQEVAVSGYSMPETSVSSSGKSLAIKANRVAESAFDRALETLIQDIEDHPISQELRAKGTHSSAFLDTGDLFSFIGFPVDQNPVDDLIEFLKESISIEDWGVSFVGDFVYKQFKVYFPDRDEFKRDPRMTLNDWEMGNPWAFAIEEGIAGYAYYLPLYLEKSRSLAGIQNKNPVRSNNYRPTPYISPLLNKFRKNVILGGQKGGNLISFK